MKIPFFDYRRDLKKNKSKILGRINKVLQSGTLILGKEVSSFEDEFAKYAGVKFGIGVNSGTDAIKIAFTALGLKKGDEIITVANTAIPTISAIRELGLIPRFVDIKDDYLINENLIEGEITSKTRAILPVHLFGNVCNMPAIIKIAKKYKLKVVEDCAQSHGAKRNSKKAASYGDIACFSFYPTKNLGAYGDGGMIVTSNKKLADTCRSLRMYGTKGEYFAHVEGYNSRLDEIQAGILRVKLKNLENNNKIRSKIAKYYSKYIKNPAITLPVVSSGTTHSFHLYVIRSTQREKLLTYLKAKGIGYGIHYKTPIHHQAAYKFLQESHPNLINTEKFAKEIISLPIFPELTKTEIEYIVKSLNAFK